MRFLLLALLAVLPASPASAAPFGPFRSRGAPVTSDARAEVHEHPRLPSSDPMWFAFQVYRYTLSSQDGPKCGHSPTCSLYGVQAVRRHRVVGFFLAVDRMWRTGRSSELRPLPIVYGVGMPRLYDPLDANDFWLRGIPDLEAPQLLPERLRQ